MIAPGVARARIAALLFVFVWLSGAWFGSDELNPNNATRMFAAISLVEDHDATIDDYAPLTIDKARFGDHYYMDKAPGMTLMAVPVVAAVNAVTGTNARQARLLICEVGASGMMRPRIRLAAALTSALITAIATALLFVMIAELTGSMAAGLFASLSYALGTPIWGWSTTIFGHASAAGLLLIAAIAIWRGTRDAAPSGAQALLAGLALGWAIVVEYQAALSGVAIGVWALWRLWRYPASARWRSMALAAGGAIVALVPLAIYNLVAFGTLLKLGYEGVVGFSGMQQGLFGLTYPKPEVIGEILAGAEKGLIWVAPILLVAPIGLVQMIRQRETRDLGIMAVAVAAIVILINASYVYWDGGSSTGPRLSVPAIGFLALGLGPLWTWCRHRAARVALAALLAASMALNLIIAAVDITAPEFIRWPVVTWIIDKRLAWGALRDFPAEHWGWSPWSGLWLYGAIATLFLAAMLWTLRRPQIQAGSGSAFGTASSSAA
ncbi:hypothetical protein [Hephaestia mangrovi]|uniref:hypothetical protein n=1 Tax=Hephaestia mangrovi TaxID=2873268 RepID=UPI001CA7794F|nr:hypothetical protein [Hephaestia mangrovi]MBY8828169.1 hypothetical protein [Hephaestia mangrovi]